MRYCALLKSRPPCVAALFFLLCAVAVAVKPEVWRQDSYEDFAAGKVFGVSIAPEGTLSLAPELSDFARVEAEHIWSLAAAVDGTLYAGTGDEGRIFKIDPQGQVSLFFDSPEIAIHALALDGEGRLYAGSAPDGLIYRIDARGQASTLARTGAHYVWDLAFDGEGRLYAATGESGQVLALSSEGEVEVRYAPPDRHVMALLFIQERLWVATAQAGRIYELEGAGGARLVYEAAQAEFNHLVAGEDGALYASANPQSEDGDEAAEGAAALYRLDGDGAVESIWQPGEGLIFDLVRDAQGRLLVASGAPERLYRREGGKRFSLLAQFEDAQPSRLLPAAGGGARAGAAQSGRLWRLGAASGQSGRFESAVHDFQVHARWGALNWRATTPEHTRIAVQTRSGNSAEPDESWSPWSVELSASGSAIPSPPARFLQYRVALRSESSGRTPELRGVSLVGQQSNLRPRIIDLQIFPYRPGQSAGQGGQDPGVPPGGAGSNGRHRLPQRKSLRLVRWQAQDPNGDELRHSLYLRGEGQREWKLVQENLLRTSLVWDTELMPEGLTVLKLVSSDYPDNPQGRALAAQRLSAPFLIDHSPPRIELEQSREREQIAVEVEVRDEISPVRRLQYSVDYGETVRQIAPADGIFDSREERARFVVEDLAPGEHVIAVQAWDQLDNVGARQLVVQVE